MAKQYFVDITKDAIREIKIKVIVSTSNHEESAIYKLLVDFLYKKWWDELPPLKRNDRFPIMGKKTNKNWVVIIYLHAISHSYSFRSKPAKSGFCTVLCKPYWVQLGFWIIKSLKFKLHCFKQKLNIELELYMKVIFALAERKFTFPSAKEIARITH